MRRNVEDARYLCKASGRRTTSGEIPVSSIAVPISAGLFCLACLWRKSPFSPAGLPRVRCRRPLQPHDSPHVSIPCACVLETEISFTSQLPSCLHPMQAALFGLCLIWQPPKLQYVRFLRVKSPVHVQGHVN